MEKYSVQAISAAFGLVAGLCFLSPELCTTLIPSDASIGQATLSMLGIGAISSAAPTTASAYIGGLAHDYMHRPNAPSPY